MIGSHAFVYSYETGVPRLKKRVKAYACGKGERSFEKRRGIYFLPHGKKLHDLNPRNNGPKSESTFYVNVPLGTPGSACSTCRYPSRTGTRPTSTGSTPPSRT